MRVSIDIAVEVEERGFFSSPKSEYIRHNVPDVPGRQIQSDEHKGIADSLLPAGYKLEVSGNIIQLRLRFLQVFQQGVGRGGMVEMDFAFDQFKDAKSITVYGVDIYVSPTEEELVRLTSAPRA